MANIKFMPLGVDLWAITAITSSATGHAKELMQDRRLGTYWEGANTNQTDIDIDLGAVYGAITATDFLLYIHPGGSHNLTIIFSKNADYSSPITGYSASSTQNTWAWKLCTLDPNYIDEGFRYVRFRFSSLTAAPKIALIFGISNYEITIRYNYGNTDGDKDYSGVQLVESLAGQCGVPKAKTPRKIWRHVYEYLDATNKAKLDAIIDAVCGKRLPFPYIDESSVVHYVRMINDSIGATVPAAGYFNTGEIVLREEL